MFTTMSNKRLGEIAKKEIETAMRGLSGTAAKQMAVRLAEIHDIGWQRIYTLTKHLRPERKKRADAGKRTFEIVEGTDLWTAAQFVIVDKLDPDQALLTCQVRGLTNLPTLETFQRMLRENGLNRQARRIAKRAFRRWEAEFPGEIFQIDVTALKVRWQDEKTRRILRIDGVDKNHPQMDPDKLRVWQIMLVDDHSRRRFLRYVVTRAITSTEMVRFLCEAFIELCIPHKIYSDQGGELKGRHIHAAKILNSLLKDQGGYVHMPHSPHNAQATGKVENAHKWAEKMDRLVGLAITEGQTVTIEDLNRFADRACEDYNNRPHRVTKETPMARWYAKRVVLRKLPAEVVESALLSDEFTVTLDAGMTVARDGQVYKIPGVQPFVDFIGQKVSVVVPPNIDLILIALPNGAEYEVEKIFATADKAGEFRSTADSNAETLKKRLKETRREEVKATKQKQKQTGEILPVPHYNVMIEQPATNVAMFPHAEHVVPVEVVNKVTPIPTPLYEGRDIGYWEAVAEFSSAFENVDETKNFMLELFPGMDGIQPFAKVEEAVNRRHDRDERRSPLRAVS
jgi:hypothetical protein